MLSMCYLLSTSSLLIWGECGQQVTRGNARRVRLIFYSCLSSLAVTSSWDALCSCTAPCRSLSLPEIPGSWSRAHLLPQNILWNSLKASQVDWGRQLSRRLISLHTYLTVVDMGGDIGYVMEEESCGKMHLLSPVNSTLEVTLYFFRWSLLLSDVKCLGAQCHKPASKGSPFPNKLEEVPMYLIHSSKPPPAHVKVAHTCTELCGSQQAGGLPQQMPEQKLLIFFNLVMRCSEETRASHSGVADQLLTEVATRQAYLGHTGRGWAVLLAWSARLITACYRR